MAAWECADFTLHTRIKIETISAITLEVVCVETAVEFYRGCTWNETFVRRSRRRILLSPEVRKSRMKRSVIHPANLKPTILEQRKLPDNSLAFGSKPDG
jgi:hypothetical protein